MLELVKRMAERGDAPATIDDGGELSHAEVLDASARLAHHLLRSSGRPGLDGERIALWLAPSRHWPVALLGTWRAGGFAVPLALSHPEPELEYTLADSGASKIVASAELAPKLRPLAEHLGLPLLILEEIPNDGASPSPPASHLPTVGPDDPALLIYTSGTTGRPKGVVLTHGNLEAQMACLHEAWGWSADDAILETLPLHHVHGITNVVLCSLWAGARCRFLPRFDAERVWQLLATGELTLYMAVPTIYVRLIAAWEEASEADRRAFSAGARHLRLMVSGSAALPVPVLERWRRLTGHTLLERYGMSEIGMALSNPLDGERLAGTVGRPLPGVELRLVDAEGREVDDGEPGEVEVRGPMVFREYWQRPEATGDAFRDGWFRTGDMAVRGGDQPEGVYRLLGRSSVDILKSGGEKISALEIEAVLREHPAIRDCAVVGLPDPEWGQRVAVAIEAVAIEGAGLDLETPDLETLRDWCKSRLAVYKIPSRLLNVDALPRNALGKVQKPAVIELFEA